MTPCMIRRLRVNGFGDLAGSDAGRAGVDALGRAVDHRTNTLDVRVPATLGAPVGVADIHAEARALATHVTYRCHCIVLLRYWFSPLIRSPQPLEAERSEVEPTKISIAS